MNACARAVAPAAMPVHTEPHSRCAGHHGLGVNDLVGVGQDLFGAARCALQRVALAAGAAHAQRVPALQPRQRVVALQERDQHLVGRRRHRRRGARW